MAQQVTDPTLGQAVPKCGGEADFSNVSLPSVKSMSKCDMGPSSGAASVKIGHDPSEVLERYHTRASGDHTEILTPGTEQAVEVRSNVDERQLANLGVYVSVDGDGVQNVHLGDSEFRINDGKTAFATITAEGDKVTVTTYNKNSQGRVYQQSIGYDSATQSLGEVETMTVK